MVKTARMDALSRISERSFGTGLRMLESEAPSISHVARTSHRAILCRSSRLFSQGSLGNILAQNSCQDPPEAILRVSVIKLHFRDLGDGIVPRIKIRDSESNTGSMEWIIRSVFLSPYPTL